MVGERKVLCPGPIMIEQEVPWDPKFEIFFQKKKFLLGRKIYSPLKTDIEILNETIGVYSCSSQKFILFYLNTAEPVKIEAFRDDALLLWLVPDYELAKEFSFIRPTRLDNKFKKAFRCPRCGSSKVLEIPFQGAPFCEDCFHQKKLVSMEVGNWRKLMDSLLKEIELARINDEQLDLDYLIPFIGLQKKERLVELINRGISKENIIKEMMEE